MNKTFIIGVISGESVKESILIESNFFSDKPMDFCGK